MAEIGDITLKSDEEIQLEIYHDQIMALIISVEGTIPGSRGFGIPLGTLSKPQPVVVNSLVAELAEKVDEFIPGIRVISATAEGTPDGDMDLTVKIGRRTG